MELNQIIRKKYLLLLLILILSIFLFQKYEKRSEVKKLSDVLTNEKNEITKKIEDENNKILEKQKLAEEQLLEINNISLSLDSNTLKSETEFKKMIYLFSRESGLEIKEIGKAENIWKKEKYSLKYIFFTFQGDLLGMTKFLYFINKSKVYTDMSKSYIELTKDKFKISLGYLEKNNE